MRKTLLLCFGLLFFLMAEVAAQRVVTGKVSSMVDGLGLPGATVQIQGTSEGVITDFDGNYRLEVPGAETVLRFSSVGYETVTETVGSRSTIDISLAEDIQKLQEVVVTAIGIKREERALGYAVENVGGEQVQQVAEPDALRALQGKVAGVNIGGTSGAPGSSTRITIRGNSSLLGDNQPLFVVDGIPFNNDRNTVYDGTSNPGLSNGSANTSRIADLDPNNIESITVLKGAAAAALYGTRAANGVVVITTKTGASGASKKGLEVSVSSAISWEEVANLPDYQNVYGTGTNFNYAQVNGSWGAPFIGARPYATTDSILHWYSGRPGMEAFDGVMVPYRAYPDNVKDLFQTGHIYDNSVSINAGSEKSSIGLTVSRTDHEGYVPNTEFERTNASVGGTTFLENGLNFGANLQYSRINQRAVQSGVGQLGGNNSSAFARALYLGRNWDVQGQPFQNPVDLGSEFMVGRGQADNPYWSYKNAGGKERIDRVLASMNVGYDFTEWLNFTYKIGINTYVQNNIDFIRPGSTGPSSNPGVGQVIEGNTRFEEIESNFIVNFNKDFNEDFSLTALVGHNFNQRTRDTQRFQGLNYIVFDIDDLDNTNSVIPFGGGYSQRRILGVYADASVGYRDWAYLSLTARNDWSSTLPKDNNSFFYPAVAVSAIVTDALDMQSNILDYLKVRASYAEVGSDTDPYQLRPVFLLNPTVQTSTSTNVFPFKGIPGATLENTVYDPDLKPERTREYEVGLDAKLINNKLGIDLSFYDRESFDQIAPISLPSVSGFSSLLTNFGTIKNRGVELGLDVTPVQSENFRWNLYGTFTHNKNTIDELTDVVPEIQFGAAFTGTPRSVHREGEEYGLLLGTVDVRDDEGNLLIDPSNGQMIRAPDLAIIANPNPDFIVGITNTLTFKGFKLNAVVDWRQGGELWSNTVLSMLGRGVTKDTENREMNWVIPGVYGDPITLEPLRDFETGEKIPNTTQIETNSLYFGETFAINAANEWAVWDATTYRLREVTIGYTVPKNLLEGLPFGSASINVTGRNLWYWAPNFPEHTNYDPEVNQFGNSNQQGIEYSATPTTRRYSVGLRFTF